MFSIVVDGSIVDLAPNQAIVTGYTGRDREDVQKHIDELADVGISRPDSVPATYRVSPRTVVADPDDIHVIGEETSGEAEFGLFVTGDDIYVVAASDHTDRELEHSNIRKSKQITPSVISQQGWRLTDVEEHWDEIHLRAWTESDGEPLRYQDGSVADILPPTQLLETVEEAYGNLQSGTLVLSGTVSTITDELLYGSNFTVELQDPIRERTLSVSYDVKQI